MEVEGEEGVGHPCPEGGVEGVEGAVPPPYPEEGEGVVEGVGQTGKGAWLEG